jgi:hypothetical protein
VGYADVRGVQKEYAGGRPTPLRHEGQEKSFVLPRRIESISQGGPVPFRAA